MILGGKKTAFQALIADFDVKWVFGGVKVAKIWSQFWGQILGSILGSKKVSMRGFKKVGGEM
jgi:F420-0:gamma-glutamyl ligase-like protein